MLADAYDELPLWSAAPGNLLLENFPYRSAKAVLDIGCGTGFPLLLLARRLGPSARLFGVDTWQAALERTAGKIAAWKLQNVELIEADARQIPLADASIDRITSNLGLNNFDDVPAVLAECRRLLTPGTGRLCIATNLRGTFSGIHDGLIAATQGHPAIQRQIEAQAQHRQTLPGLEELLGRNGFLGMRKVEAVSTFTYADGTAFLNDYFTVMGFLPGWKSAIPDTEWEAVFGRLEQSLNAAAQAEGCLRLTVPIAYLELRQA